MIYTVITSKHLTDGEKSIEIYNTKDIKNNILKYEPKVEWFDFTDPQFFNSGEYFINKILERLVLNAIDTEVIYINDRSKNVIKTLFPNTIKYNQKSLIMIDKYPYKHNPEAFLKEYTSELLDEEYKLIKSFGFECLSLNSHELLIYTGNEIGKFIVNNLSNICKIQN